MTGLFAGLKAIHWIFLGVAGVVALCAGGYVGYTTDNRLEEKRIAGIDAQIRDPKTGYLKQIADVGNDLAVCRDTVDKQDKAIASQNKAASDLKNFAAAAARRAQDAMAEADAHKREAQELSVALAARRPANGSYSDLVAFTQEAIP